MMEHIQTSERWDTVADLFDKAVTLSGPEREGFLQEACAGDPELLAQLGRLIAAHERPGALDMLADRLGPDVEAALPPPQSPLPGSHIGPYRILETLGSGGQGVVFLAQRDGEGFRQRVAIKVLRVGVQGDRRALVSRFLAERSILARLEHPNIPRFLDGGLTARGEPFFAMEYVRGVGIDRYCDTLNLAIRQRLSLFAAVCDAVQYAHRHLVVHRDLKPSNILVTEDGVVKVLDFGIAKLLDAPPVSSFGDSPVTGAGQRWMTTYYASPEQVRGEAVTTATDVFALGVVLYELLCCASPHLGGSKHDLERAILEVDPAKPSAVIPAAAEKCEKRGMDVTRLQRELAGDLDTISLKALSKAPERRYATAGELADDIRRYLGGLPVHARTDSAAYRLRKFVGRHRVRVAALSIAALSLVTAGIAFTVAAGKATRSAAQAERERQRAEEVSRFAVELFRAANPARAGSADITARELLDSGAARLRRGLIDDPERRASMLVVLAQSYAGLGRYGDAHGAAAEAVALRRATRPSNLAGLAEALELHARMQLARGAVDSAGMLAHEALALRRAARAAPAEVAVPLSILADYFHAAGGIDSAAHYLQAAVAESDKTPSNDPLARADILSKLGLVLSGQGRFAAAESTQVRVLALRRAIFPEGHPSIAATLTLVSNAQAAQGKVASAVENFQSILEMREKALGRDHPDVANTLHTLAALSDVDGRLDKDSVVALATRAITIKRQALGANHVSLARTLSVLGGIQRRRGNYVAAESLVTRTLDIQRATYGEDHVEVGRSLNRLAILHRATKGGRVAEPMHRRAREIVIKSLPADNPEILQIEMDLGATLLALGRVDEAEPLIRRARALLLGSIGWDDRRRALQGDTLLARLDQMRRGAARPR